MATASTRQEILALIPARGGSKGIPGKNIRPLAGLPLVAHTLGHVQAAPAVSRIAVSTDDDAIASVAQEYGAQIIRRPREISGDEASSESALVHSLAHLKTTEGYAPDLVVFLQATSPLRRPDDIQNAIETLIREDADSLFSAGPVHGFVWRRQEGQLQALTYDPNRRPRRQDIGDDFLENGSIYIFKPWVLERFGNRLGGKIALYPMAPLDSFQVDEAGDFELMEDLLTLQEGGASTFRAPFVNWERLASIRLLVLDFDGVLTDDRVLVHQDGTEAVFCHRGDGLGLERLRHAGIAAAVLSKEKNPVVAARCRKLGLPCHQGYDEKLPKLREIVAKAGLEAAQVAFMGNDLNDLECLHWAGLALAPADARPEVRELAEAVTRTPGGRGAVREVCDWFQQVREDRS